MNLDSLKSEALLVGEGKSLLGVLSKNESFDSALRSVVLRSFEFVLTAGGAVLEDADADDCEDEDKGMGAGSGAFPFVCSLDSDLSRLG